MSVCIRFSDTTETHDLQVSQRDCGILMHDPEGQSFCREIGVYEFMTVATGIPKGAQRSVNRNRLAVIVSLLMERLTRDQELLSFDYDCEWVQRSDLSAVAGTEFPVVRVHRKQKGFCTLVVVRADPGTSGREIANFDLREKNELWRIVLESCKVTRRRAKFNLVESVRKLSQFLDVCKSQDVSVVYMTKG